MSIGEPTPTQPIHLEAYAEDCSSAAVQAKQLIRLVAAQTPHLAHDWPDVVAGYSTFTDAYRRVRRLAASEELDAYIISEDDTAIGLATVIRDQHVVHPSEGRVEGDDLDYWLKSLSSNGLHRAVVDRLCDGQDGRPAFATVVSGSAQQRQKDHAFGLHMRPVGDPAPLSTNGPDRFMIARGGAEAQVYQLA